MDEEIADTEVYENLQVGTRSVPVPRHISPASRMFLAQPRTALRPFPLRRT